jgi:hypothetical protein
MPAACYLPPAVTNNLERGYRIHFNINVRIDKNDLESLYSHKGVNLVPLFTAIGFPIE